MTFRSRRASPCLLSRWVGAHHFFFSIRPCSPYFVSVLSHPRTYTRSYKNVCTFVTREPVFHYSESLIKIVRDVLCCISLVVGGKTSCRVSWREGHGRERERENSRAQGSVTKVQSRRISKGLFEISGPWVDVPWSTKITAPLTHNYLALSLSSIWCFVTYKAVRDEPSSGSIARLLVIPHEARDTKFHHGYQLWMIKGCCNRRARERIDERFSFISSLSVRYMNKI